MRIKKQISLMLAAIISILALTITSSAHSTSQRGLVYGGEIVGWIIDEDYHTNSNSLTYKIDSSANNTMHRWIIESGARMWNDYGYFITQDNANSNFVIKAQNYGYANGSNARITNASVDSNRHFTKWEIIINTFPGNSALNQPAANPTALSIAHEFGHALGLNELTGDNNKDKIMYQYANTRTATNVTSFDLDGARVITGGHTHSSSTAWSYRNDYKSIGTKVRNTHKQACYGQGKCGGFRGTGGSTTICSYGSNNRCTTCSVHRNGDVNMDGSRTNADVELILGFRAGTRTLTSMQFHLADVDGDRYITMQDVMELQKFLAGMNSVIE
jgi:hypothetical protein